MKHCIFIIFLFLPNIGACAEQKPSSADYYLRQVIHHFSEQSKIEIDEKAINVNNAIAKQRIDFLNKDFNTENFSTAKTVSYINYLSTENNERIHLGVIALEFDSCDDMDKSYSSVVSSKRTNFMVKVLTRFIVLKRGKNIIFIYSETPFQDNVRAFMKTANDIEASSSTCVE